jgi:hypothetical protein
LLRMISLIRLYTYTSVKYVWNPFYFYLAKTTYSPRIDSHNSIAGWPDTARARQRRAWFLVVHEWRTLLLGVVNFFWSDALGPRTRGWGSRIICSQQADHCPHRTHDTAQA